MLKLFVSLLFLQMHQLADGVKPRVCIIGAGLAGLTTAKHMKDERINVTVLEATGYLGGTWRYEEKVGTDEFGYPIYTSMYKHLRTNLPKATMELMDYPMPEEYPSFPFREQFYKYIESYSKHFELEKHIKFYHQVLSVKRVGNVWKVKHMDISTGEHHEEDYDYIVVGTGHHSKPNYPSVPGENLFKGTVIHSHDYRVPDPYKQRRVLVVGAGPSGLDISLHIAEVSKTLVHSHHSLINFQTPFPPHYIRKPDVKEFNETGVVFTDGTFEEIDDVVYCTGFYYDFPFLDESSQLSLAPHSVTPLYKYMVNIRQPTMFFLGMIVRACVVVAINAQAQYVTALVKGNFTLPSEKEMMISWQRHADSLRSSGKPLSHIHLLSEKEDQYYADLTKEAGIERVPPVMFKIRTMDIEAKIKNFYTFRDYSYTVIDKDTFVRSLETRVESEQL